MATQVRYNISSEDIREIGRRKQVEGVMLDCCEGFEPRLSVHTGIKGRFAVTISCGNCGLKIEKPIDRTTDHALADVEKLIRQWAAVVAQQ